MGEERREKEKEGGREKNESGRKKRQRVEREEEHTLTHQPKKWLGTNTSILSIMIAKEPLGWPGV